MLITLLIYSVVIFSLAHYLTGLCVKFFPRIKLLDNPNERKKHKASTATSGGIVVAILLSLATIFYYFYINQEIKIIYLLAAIIILAVISTLDDIFHLQIIIRLPVQFLSSWLVIQSLSPIHVPQLDFIPSDMLNIIILVGMVYFINIYNFMDGIDGSASSVAIHIAVSFIIIVACFGSYEDNKFFIFLALTLSFACKGFLAHNWSPAKIFLGDVGSTVIGLVCGTLMLVLSKNGFLAAAIIIPGYYIADSTITLLKRIIRKERFWEPHTQHFFQVAARNLNCHAKVTKKIIKYNSVLLSLSILSVFLPRLSILLAIIVIYRILNKFVTKNND